MGDSSTTANIFALYENNRPVFWLWIVRYLLAYFILLPSHIYCIYQFYKMKDTAAVKKRHYVPWMSFLILAFICGNRPQMANFLETTPCSYESFEK